MFQKILLKVFIEVRLFPVPVVIRVVHFQQFILPTLSNWRRKYSSCKNVLGILLINKSMYCSNERHFAPRHFLITKMFNSWIVFQHNSLLDVWRFLAYVPFLAFWRILKTAPLKFVLWHFLQSLLFLATKNLMDLTESAKLHQPSSNSFRMFYFFEQQIKQCSEMKFCTYF